MRQLAFFGAVGATVLAGLGIGVVTANTSGLDTWMSGKNHNRIIEIQRSGGVQADSQKVGIAFFSNSAFRITSPKGITMMVDPWRNDPSGAWGLWYRMEFPKAEVDIGLSTHAHFDHDALGRLDANMLLDRMAGSFALGDVKITGIADKHQCVAPGTVAWTDAVKQFEGREDVCPPTNARHFDNNIYLIETGGIKLLMWGDNRPEPPPEVWDRIGEVDVIFVPVDGSRHILDYKQADSIVEKSKAKIAIPHHYLVPETTFITSTLLPATEWVERHRHTMLESASIEISAADLEGKSGHVYYFGSHHLAAETGGDG
ncbi:MBL fold metallo-hydrolase [Thioalkalivibrio sp. HK1]|uniref:MBL fold metallo-hydrolase n=1 Tax=Thioalkalivibrio sp. HK1 TaxID=1469245 RepID=UPI0004B970FD|nr:MBL fold metallo-hydrolase [Thioalkalivibrio sp. HK1]